MAFYSEIIALTELNYPFYNEELLGVIKVIKLKRLKLKGIEKTITIIIDY